MFMHESPLNASNAISWDSFVMGWRNSYIHYEIRYLVVDVGCLYIMYLQGMACGYIRFTGMARLIPFQRLLKR